MRKLIAKKFDEKTTEQQIRARYEELTQQQGVAPDAAASSLAVDFKIPLEKVLPMLTQWGYLHGPMDNK
jgi:hypothetical protein